MLFSSNRGWNRSVCSSWSSITQTVSVWHHSTARAIRKHAEHLFSALMSYDDRSACIRWRHIRFKLAWESKTVTEAEDQTSSTILSAPSCFETLWILHTAGKTWLKCLQSNIALHISTYFVEHLTIIFMCKFRILVLESFMVQGTLNIHCMCMLLK